MRIIIILGLLILIVTLGVIATFQRSLIYFPSHEDELGKGTGEFRPLQDKGGQFLGYVRTADNTERIVIFFHGNGGEALHRQWIGLILPEETVTVVLAEYPGYGALSGSPSEATIRSAALHVFDTVRVSWDGPITVLGESLGTAVASYVAAHRPIDRLALISPFTSLIAAARHHFPYLPVGLMLRDRFASDELLSQVQVPLHIIHGTDDMVVPFALGRQLFEDYPGDDKTFTELTGVDHNDIVMPIVKSPHAAAFRAFMSQ